MFYALSAGRLDTGDLRFVHVLRDIETLNRWAQEGRLEVTALSIHAYAYVADRYLLLPHGASVGRQYGPLLTARNPSPPDALRGKPIAVPGTLTTAHLALRILLGEFEPVPMPFDQILDAVAEGRAPAGLIIHEGQLTYARRGLCKVADLGEWWHRETGLPLPLGANAIRRDLGADLYRRVSELLRKSIRYGLAHRQEALTHAMQFSRGLDRDLADRFVGMYVNDDTLAFTEETRRAIGRLLDEGHRRGVLPKPIIPQFVEG